MCYNINFRELHKAILYVMVRIRSKERVLWLEALES